MPSVVLTSSNAAWAWSVVAPATTITIEALGGGGGGGGVSHNTEGEGGGGMGGAYSKVTITKGAETTLAIVVGAAGTAGDAGNGGDGGYSQVTQDVTVVLRASGGQGGLGGALNQAYNGGTTANGTAVGDVTKTGGAGGNGNITTHYSGGGGGSAGSSTNGGTATGVGPGLAGTGALLNGTTYSQNGATGVGTAESNGATPGAGNGGGGSGGIARDSTNHTGGAGKIGIVVITWTVTASVVDSYKHIDIVTASVSAALPNISVSDNFKYSESVAFSITYFNGVYLSLSDNIAASAATHTTAQLTAPAGKTSGADFVEGHISDDTNPIETDLGSGKYTELEWSCITAAGLSTGDEIEFRITDEGTVIDTYSVTPKITIGVGVTHLNINVSDCTSQETIIGA